MDTFWQAVAQHDWTPPTVKQEFRVYYDEQGNITAYSMEDLPGNYVVVDRHIFDQTRMDLKVKDGHLIKITKQSSWKLQPTEDASYSCHSDDVTVIVDALCEKKKFWKVTTTNEAS